MPTNTNNPATIEHIPTILHDFIKQVVVLRPSIDVREEISYAEHDQYIGFDLLKNN